MESAVCQRFEFTDKADCINILNRFRKFYKFERIHVGLGYLFPFKYLSNIGISMKNKAAYKYKYLEKCVQVFAFKTKFYNFTRIHVGLEYLSPFKYLSKLGISMKNNEA